MRASRSAFRIASACALLAFPAAAGAQTIKLDGVDSLQVRVNLQAQFNTTSVDEEPSSEWLVRRARVGVRGWLAGWIFGFVEGDFGDGDSRLTDGYVRLDLGPVIRLQAGQFKKPFDALELTSSRELLVVERTGTPRGGDGATPHGLVRGLRYSDRDLGATVSGRFSRAVLTGGVFNGDGANIEEGDDGKQLAARAQLGGGGGWTVAGGWSALRLSAPPGPDEGPLEPAWVQAVEGAVTYGDYFEPGWKALLQAMAGDNWDPGRGGGGDASFTALQAIVAHHWALFTTPYLVGVEPAARVGWADPDTDDEEDGKAVLWTVGVNLYHHRHLKTQLGIDHLDPDVQDGSTAFRVQATLEF